jgi:EAL domain-containing protein (putative c-di-GMP-specific phosphodiesterase class I)
VTITDFANVVLGLRSLGCTQMQGFLFSAARPAQEIRAMLGVDAAVSAA